MFGSYLYFNAAINMSMKSFGDYVVEITFGFA